MTIPDSPTKAHNHPSDELFYILELHRCSFYEESFQHIMMMHPLVDYRMD